MILGIDPGNTESGVAIVCNDYSIAEAAKLPNEEVLDAIWRNEWGAKTVVIECMQSYGMAVGRTVFETCYAIGRFWEAAESTDRTVHLYPRPKIFRSIVGEQKGGDAALRRALLTRFGGDKKGEPLYKLKGATDKRSAYAVAVYYLDGAKLGEW